MVRDRLTTLPAILLCCPSVGCLAAYSTRPVDVVVTRTDTGQPASGVPVTVSYASMLVLNQPKNVDGTTDAAGRVMLPMADFLSGPYLQAGTTKYWAPSENICAGGSLTYKPSANPDEPVPTYAVLLVPRQRSLIHRLLDSRKTAPAQGASTQSAILAAAPGCVTPEMRGPLDYGRVGWLLYGDDDSPAQRERTRKVMTELWGNTSTAAPAQCYHADNP